MPVAVEVGADDKLELLWDEPNPFAPAPWVPTEGGWSWRLAPGTDSRSLGTVEPTPGLVAVGTREGRKLLVNLEALGALSIVGDHAATESFVHSMILELASADHPDARCFVVGAGLVADQLLGRFRRTTAADAFSYVATACNRGAQQDASSRRSFAHRGSGASGQRGLTIVIAAADQFQEAASMNWVAPNLGAAMVLLGAAPTTSTLTIEADGSASLQPLGLQFEALARSGEPEVVPSRGDDRSPGSTAVRHCGGEAQDQWELPAPELLVRVLGAPRVEGYPQLGRIDVSLVAFLACNGGQATEDQLINAVWGGRAIGKATLWNRISKVRISLGSAIPPRDQGSNIIRLGTGVVTDLAMVNALYARTTEKPDDAAAALLGRAVAMIEGPPFDAAGYGWSYDNQFNADACNIVERTCVRLAELALHQNDLESARRAISIGLKALPLNESLYRWRMRAESQAANRAGVRAALVELRKRLSDLDGQSSPSIQTVELFQRLWTGEAQSTRCAIIDLADPLLRTDGHDGT
ncbi:MAG: bacterial transcriptional activator domain-containing protein [Actinomycetota bacterium]|nr:bacterial transcriptional activator domain-containing protein [Actinomycetota bacterium]